MAVALAVALAVAESALQGWQWRSAVLWGVVWPAYWWCQGAVLTGVWVLAHECGHGAFSDSKAVNDAVGTVCHSALLVPYHAWRLSHGRHHAKTGDLDNDEVFVPATRADLAGTAAPGAPVPPPPSSGVVVLQAAVMEVFGWPMYLLTNVTGPKKYRTATATATAGSGSNSVNGSGSGNSGSVNSGSVNSGSVNSGSVSSGSGSGSSGSVNSGSSGSASHFNPNSVLFKDSERADVAQSLVCWGLAVAGMAAWIATYGLAHWARFYFVPLLVVNGWLVTITYLQHTDPAVPHYRRSEWTWLRGALATVDRDYGVLNTVFHGITDTHVAHHLFSYMPFYHAREATDAIKPILGEYYNQRSTPIARALFESFQECRFVDENDGDVLFYHRE